MRPKKVQNFNYADVCIYLVNGLHHDFLVSYRLKRENPLKPNTVMLFRTLDLVRPSCVVVLEWDFFVSRERKRARQITLSDYFLASQSIAMVRAPVVLRWSRLRVFCAWAVGYWEMSGSEASHLIGDFT